MDLESRIFELALEGKCCSQIIMSVGIEVREKENPDLIKAMKGLCHGLSTRRLCGALSGGACLLAYYHETYAPVLVQELVSWFEKKYETVDCAGLIGSSGFDMQKCQGIIQETCAYCFELLEKNNLMDEED